MRTVSFVSTIDGNCYLDFPKQMGSLIFSVSNMKHKQSFLWHLVGSFTPLQQDVVSNICQAADRHLVQLVEWAKHIPHFTDLPIEDQVVLLKAGELL